MSETDFGQNKGQNGLEMKTPPIHIKAGPQRISAAFIQRLDGPVDDLIAPLENTLADVNISYGVTALPHLRDMTIIGPSMVTGVSDTPSRRRSSPAARSTANEEETVRRADRQEPDGAGVSRRRAGRRHPGRAGVLRARPQDRRLRERHPPGAAVDSGQPALPVPPRAESPAHASKAAAAYRISDQDLASRLSFFLWGAGPDAELIKAATAAGCARRSGSRSRCGACSPTSAPKRCRRGSRAQWLRLQDLEKIIPDYLLYPQYDDTLAQAMMRETELFFDSIVREDRSVLDLLTADYTFVNERLAKHYGIPNVTGTAVPPRARAGRIAAACSARAAS